MRIPDKRFMSLHAALLLFVTCHVWAGPFVFSGNMTANASKTTYRKSIKLDATLEKTLKITFKTYKSKTIDPDTADMLVKESYALSGPTLHFFPGELMIPTDLLASAVIRSVPRKATRTELTHIMEYIIPELEIRTGLNTEAS